MEDLYREGEREGGGRILGERGKREREGRKEGEKGGRRYGQ